ncbi:MAG: hypothetical protein HOP25_00360 [Methylotenera sp.]|nr:hypothetical protein [Methylotenera sp.]
MKTHALIDLATKRFFKEIPELPKGAFYNIDQGYWMLDGEALVKSNIFLSSRVSKKCDQETGEDQKGE